jgi:uncharacterized membrane protein
MSLSEHAPNTSTDDKVLPIVVYALYLLGWASFAVAPLIGFFIAYVQKDHAAHWARTHYVFLIRTVWIALIWFVVAGLLVMLGIPLTIILIGFALLKVAGLIAILVGVWVSVRCVVGLIYASRGEAYPRPRTWLV